MKQKVVNNSVFGLMEYDFQWEKTEKISIFKKEYDITISAEAYSEENISKKQEESYLKFKENEKFYIETIENKLKEYINENLEDLATYWVGARKIINTSDLAKVVEPKSILFQQDGTILFLAECEWDIENGIAVKLYPEIEVGPQDIFI
ncbi:DUF6985 domain-containing protein [Fusobacterium polymorphum]|uniref:DUF6985 domain-containing protein n=1 Tax=Fusobacterium nucleatum subsp. polymorphum TaxID=76857 RepID=UPI000BFD1F58|nr:hypothetical protein [Fusobacterium polymorphum]PHI05320.1 hypothetical protein CA845_10255 [Fusobacterium polymorphum]